MDNINKDYSDEYDVADYPKIEDAVEDTSSQLDFDLDSMSLDELYALRNELTETDDASGDTSDNWIGTPTHAIEWYDDQDSQQRVLRK